MSFFVEKQKRKLTLPIYPKPNIQRVMLDGHEGMPCGWYIVRLDDTDGTWEVVTGPETKND